jgi:hypothetical protein
VGFTFQARRSTTRLTALPAAASAQVTAIGTGAGTVKVNPTVPLATFSDLPMIDYADVFQANGDNTAQPIFNRAAARAASLGLSTGSLHYLQLPSGLLMESVDFTQAGVYSIYAPNCCGILGPGKDQAVIQIRPNSTSSATLAKVPAQSTKQTNPLYLMRLGPNNSTSGRAVHLQGFTLRGTDQLIDPNTGLPMAYGGYNNYWGRNATHEDIIFRAAGPGTWNSPPGETTNYAGYNDLGTHWRNVESNGMNTAGVRVGGGTGGGGSRSWLIEDSYIHDSRVSGCAFGTAGAPATGNDCESITTINLKVASNANHTSGGGQQFQGLNHEGFEVYAHHTNLDIWIDNQATFQKEHIGLRNGQVDCPDVRIIEPTWHGDIGGSPPYANGCLVIAVPNAYAGSADGVNKQKTLPLVVKNGVTLQPVDRTATVKDPTKHYILIR